MGAVLVGVARACVVARRRRSDGEDSHASPLLDHAARLVPPCGPGLLDHAARLESELSARVGPVLDVLLG